MNIVEPALQSQLGPAFDVERVRTDFPILKLQVEGKPLVYFDNAASSQMPQQVIDRLVHYQTAQHANINVDVGMLSCLIMHQAIDHLLRHLAGCRIVEIDQRFSLNLEFKYRKIGANAFDVERRTQLRLQSRLYNIHCSISLSLFQHSSLEPMFERSHGYAIDDLGTKCVGQQIARCKLG